MNRGTRGGGRNNSRKRTTSKFDTKDNNKKPGFKKSGPNKPTRTSKPANAPKPNDSGLVRLNKFLANAGVASRRESDELIKTGLVEVNGKVVTEMGYKVSPTDTVKFNGTELQTEKKVYVLLNKPKGFITTVDDPKARKTVMELVANACKERIYPVGRLDRKTTGVLLFTNDGELATKLLHPSGGARKIYDVTLDKRLTNADFSKIQAGLELEDGPIHVDEITFIDQKAHNHVGITIHSGRNRIVRRIFESLGYEVTKLDRVFFAGLTKKALNRGQWRRLTTKEVSFLKMK
jgi:23S rRNA pseudouridine2605 synthase